MISTSYIFGRKYGSDFLTNLVSYYPLNSNGTDLISGHNISFIGSPIYSAGKVGDGVDFLNDTVDRYGIISDNDDFSFVSAGNDVPFSISCWVKFYTYNNGTILVKRNDSNSGDEYFYFITSSIIIFYKIDKTNNSIFQAASCSHSIPLNNFMHVVITDNGTKTFAGMKIYLNGISQTTVNQSSGVYTGMSNKGQPIRIGRYPTGFISSFKLRGVLDELAIWKNRELTASEVLELYTKGNAGTPTI